MQFVIESPTLSTNQATAARQRADLERAIAAFQSLISTMPPVDVADIVSAAMVAANTTDPTTADVEQRFGGQVYTRAERAKLAMENQARGFRVRQELLADALTASQVGHRLGVSRQTPHDRVRAKTLLGVKYRGKLRFPSWQFDAEGPNGVIPSFPEVLRALSVSDFAKSLWFTNPNPYLEGRRPIDALRADPSRVIDTARGVGAR